MKATQDVRTRMAPSPTGEYHIGHIRTLLYNYALARKNHGQFIIRIEDTDQKRQVPGAQERILQVIKDYGLSWDEGPDMGGPYAPYIQTQRQSIYQEHINKLIDIKGAYYCFCSQERLDQTRQTQKDNHQVPKYDKHCLSLSDSEITDKLKSNTPHVIRLNIPSSQTIVVNDLVRGPISFNTNDVDDQILIKSNGLPTYHFAAGVDDHLMKITHVLRGDEWISSLPKQYYLYQYFKWQLPIFAHLTVFLDPAGGKMSKRHGSVSARSFLDDGYLPEALLNFLMLLGWNPGTEKEIFSLDEFVQEFSLEKLHKKQPIFDRKKLDYFNGYYLRQKTDQDLLPLFTKFLPKLDQKTINPLIPLLKERITKLSQLPQLTNFLIEDIEYDQNLLFQRQASPELVKEMLTKTLILEDISEFKYENIQKKLMDLILDNSWNTGQFFMVFRVAIAGALITPPIVECLPLLGKEKVLDRIRQAISKITT